MKLILLLVTVHCCWIVEPFCTHLRTREDSVCTLFPESVQGPYFVDDAIVRQNVTETKDGIQLELSFTVVNVTTCEPLVGVSINIWNCDGIGQYSGFEGTFVPVYPLERLFKPLFLPVCESGAGSTLLLPTVNNDRFLRGVQYTDESGTVTFYTIVPGWYTGRAMHIHVKAHVHGKTYIGQLFFDREFSNQVATTEPYRTNTVERVTNDKDSWYKLCHGNVTTLKLIQNRFGFKAVVMMGVN